MKKIWKVLIVLFCIIIIGGVLLFVNGLYGNPISKMIAKNSVKKYVEEIYSDRDFVVGDIFYNFKDSYYHTKISSPSSIDTHFLISSKNGKIAYDGYESEVVSGWNTYERLNLAYQNMVKEVFSHEDFPIPSDINFGTFELIEEHPREDDSMPNYGIKLTELQIDQSYDIKTLAKTKGYLVFYAQDEDVSLQKASELLLIIKEQMDEAKVPFYGIYFQLQKPKNVNGKPFDEEIIHVSNFLYEDIYEEGLFERVQEAHERLIKYYEEQDKLNEQNN